MDAELVLSAYHESGHAFMAYYVGARVRTVTIEPPWDDGPERHADIAVEWPHENFSDRTLREGLARVALAGPVAEMIYVGDPYHPGVVAEWAADWKVAWEAMSPLVADARRRLIQLEGFTSQLLRLLRRDQHWSALAALADHLLAHETMEGEEVNEILRYWLA